MRTTWAATLCLVAGCTGCSGLGANDPAKEYGLLAPGSRCVVIMGWSREEVEKMEALREKGVFIDPGYGADLLLDTEDGARGRDASWLDVGERVTVAKDPGYYEPTEGERERRATVSLLEGAREGTDEEFFREGTGFKDDAGTKERLRSEKPRRYPFPEPMSQHRWVRVVVRTGKYAGTSGQIRRRHLRSDG